MRKYVKPSVEICNSLAALPLLMSTHDKPGQEQLTNEAHFNDDEGLQLNNQSLWEDK